MTLFITSAHEMSQHLAKQVRSKRLSLNLTQQSLSNHAGISFSVLKKFERTGKISLESLLKIAIALGSLEEFTNLFTLIEANPPSSLEELFVDNHRKRGSK